MLYKLLNFLNTHGVEFRDGQEIFHEHTALGRKYLKLLGKEEISDHIDIAKLDFPTIYRKLYDKIYENRAAYEAFDKTSYTFIGVTPQRRMLRLDINTVY
ncbi:MAG: hypothetical protein ACRCXC_09185 [Legionella sp.]